MSLFGRGFNPLQLHKIHIVTPSSNEGWLFVLKGGLLICLKKDIVLNEVRRRIVETQTMRRQGLDKVLSFQGRIKVSKETINKVYIHT